MRAFERIDEDDGPAPCDHGGLWCSGKARWLLGNARVCTPCRRVAEEAEPHDDTAKDGT